MRTLESWFDICSRQATVVRIITKSLLQSMGVRTGAISRSEEPLATKIIEAWLVVLLVVHEESQCRDL